MATGCSIRKNEFYDSVFLVRVAKRIAERPGVQQAAALMGTDKNKLLLAVIQVSSPEVLSATPNDLIVAVVAESEQVIRVVLEHTNQCMQQDQTTQVEAVPRILDDALAQQPGSNLVAISVPGAYAAREAPRAIEHGLNVFIFSKSRDR